MAQASNGFSSNNEPISFLILCNCSVVKTGNQNDVPTIDHGQFILIKGQKIVYVGANAPILDPSAWQVSEKIDVGGRYVLPGLCDAHVHVTAVTADLHQLSSMPQSLITARCIKVLHDMLMRGFTTVRDVGGCDWGLAQAVEEGSILGPRILFCGKALSQTGGHGDMRLKGEENFSCCNVAGTDSSIGLVCDGVTRVRIAARNEIRKGASHIKIMASGGVASPTDRISNLQFSKEEIKAIVEEAKNAGIYVCAHAYTTQAIKRCLELGIRSIEHGNFLDEECAKLMAKNGAFLVPTLITYKKICSEGVSAGLSPESVAKAESLLENGLNSIMVAEKFGVDTVFGSDLLGSMQSCQLEEFSLRARVQEASSILRAATITAAQLFNLEAQVGVIATGAYADLLIVDKDPFDSIDVLLDPSNLKLIMRNGIVVKRGF